MPIDKHLSIQFPYIYLKEFVVLFEEECILDQHERVNGSVDSVSDRRLRYHLEELIVFNLENLLYNLLDSYGLDFADKGYSFIYADLVTEYVEMIVGEDTAYY
ncbi:hypothetical protein IGI04_038756 [Brassica rapa subsp. trilocularis]|uniref:Uncharacterized protein n=1 Tax=Brassica rapa subsp. trilocularis TaxID=1813537 RepID=A0ABQ7LL58_BRACM|nr:hypothetical protein IGI04_038756 [Brassica rapa subsp. trilocularis]